MKSLDKAKELLEQYKTLKKEIAKELSEYTKQDIFLDEQGYLIVKEADGLLTTSLEPAFASIEKFGIIKADVIANSEDESEEYFRETKEGNT